MPYTNDPSIGDFEKLKIALQEIRSNFGSLEDVLSAFGFDKMPIAQRYGIFFGIIVFCFTVITVLMLLTFGGSFKRMAEQAKTGDATLLSAAEARRQRALLLEQLLEGRDRMLQKNYKDAELTDQPTKLTQMLLNVAPDAPIEPDLTVSSSEKKKNAKNKERYVPPHYQDNYVHAYRKCQDRPGGAVLSGRPEARFEAYARAYAGCGPYTNRSHRRSYARMYEAVTCFNHANDEKYSELFKERPYDIVGKYVRLEALQVSRHLSSVYKVTCGAPVLEDKSYDPEDVWGFCEDGPFENEKQLHDSFVFTRHLNEAAFAVVHNVTDTVWGVVLLKHDAPEHLTIQLQPPILQPSKEGTKEQLECCFLLMDRLFGYGYRRIQMAIDSQDKEKGKLALRLGFSFEGTLLKHNIVKDANRDTNLYAVINTDWQQGARAAIFNKLHGLTALRADQNNEKLEEEQDEKDRVLAQQKAAETKKVA